MTALFDSALIAIDCATSVAGGCRGVAVDPDSLSPYIRPVSVLLRLFFVLPVTLFLSKGLRELYMRLSAGSNKPLYRWLRYMATFLFLSGSFILLVVAAMLTPPSKSKLGIIMSYLVQVHLASFLQQFVIAALRIVHTYHFSVHVLGVTCLSIGNRYCEFILLRGLLEGVDYRHWYFSLCDRAVFHIDYIYPLRPELADSLSRSSEFNYSSGDDRRIFQVNPLHQLARGRSVMVMDLIKKKPQVPSLSPRTSVQPLQLEMSPMVTNSDANQISTPPAELAPLPPAELAPLPPPPSPPADEGSAESCDVTSSVEDKGYDEDDQTASDRDRTYGDCEEMEDMTISLKKFQPQIRKDYKDKFHFWQARMKGYTDAGDLEQADIHSLQKAATVDDSNSTKSPMSNVVFEDASPAVRSEVVAMSINKRGSVMNLRQQFEHKSP
jgi:hypothetical protein